MKWWVLNHHKSIVFPFIFYFIFETIIDIGILESHGPFCNINVRNTSILFVTCNFMFRLFIFLKV